MGKRSIIVILILIVGVVDYIYDWNNGSKETVQDNKSNVKMADKTVDEKKDAKKLKREQEKAETIAHVKKVTEMDEADNAEAICNILIQCGFTNENIMSLAFNSLDYDPSISLKRKGVSLFSIKAEMDRYLDGLRIGKNSSSSETSVMILLSPQNTVEKIWIRSLDMGGDGEIFFMYQDGRVISTKSDYYVQNLEGIRKQCVDLLNLHISKLINADSKRSYIKIDNINTYQIKKSPKKMEFSLENIYLSSLESNGAMTRREIQLFENSLNSKKKLESNVPILVECDPKTEEIIHITINETILF